MGVSYSLEKLYEIWDDKMGDCIQVGPDRDGLDLIEIRYRGYDGKLGDRISFSKEQAKLVLQALQCAIADLEGMTLIKE